MVYLVSFDVFDSVAELGLLHTYYVPTYSHGVCVRVCGCVYVSIVIDGKGRRRGGVVERQKQKQGE